MARPTLVAWVLCAVVAATGSLTVGGIAAAKVRDGSLGSPAPKTAAVAASVPLSGEQTTLPKPASTTRGSITSNEVTVLLGAHTDALKAKNRAAFLAAYDPSKTDMVKQQGQLYDNLVKVPFDSAEYVSYALTGGKTTFDGAHATLDISFDHKISNVDLHAVEERYRWTIARTGPDHTLAITSVTGYPVTGDPDRKTYNYPAPWDVVPNLTVIVKPHVVLMSDPGSAGLARNEAATAEASAEYDLAHWSGGIGGAPGFTVFLSDDRKLFAGLYSGSTDVRDDEAGTAWGLTGPSSYSSYASARIVIDTSDDTGYFTHGGADAYLIFRHEMAHALVMPYDDWATNSSGTRQDNLWLVEGFAEWMSTSDHGADEVGFAGALAQWQSSHGYPKALPTNADLYSSDALKSAANYQLAQLALRYMAKTYGVEKTDAFVLSVYQRDGGSMIDEAMSSALGTTTAQFTQGWLSYVRSVS